MKKILALLLAVFLCVSLCACTAFEDEADSPTIAVPEGHAQVPNAASELDYVHVDTVVAAFADAGFYNIETQLVYDLNHGSLVDRAAYHWVRAVSVDGQSDFEADAVFPDDAPVIITYRAYEKDNPDTVFQPYATADLFADLAANPMRAKSVHMNEFVEVSGKIQEIAPNGKYIFLCPPEITDGSQYIYCSIDTDELRDQVYDLSTGDLVTLRGKINVVNLIYDYALYVYSFQ